jgi:hypothetical protein
MILKTQPKYIKIGFFTLEINLQAFNTRHTGFKKPLKYRNFRYFFEILKLV